MLTFVRECKVFKLDFALELFYTYYQGGDKMELNIAVIDDRVEDIDTVISMIKRYMNKDRDISVSISSVTSGEAFLKQFAAGKFHVVFLDICMFGMNGIELSRRIRSLDMNVAIVFMSTTTEYVFETFKATPFGYIIKHYTFEQFAEIMDKTVSHFSTVKKTIAVKIPRSEILLEADTILAVLSCGHNTEIHTASDKTIRSVEPFNYFQKNLMCDNKFIECNRGIIINLDHVLTVKNNDVVMQNGTLYPIRIRNKKYIVTEITKYLSQKLKGELYL